MTGIEGYAAYVKLLPSLVQTVLGLAQGLRRLALAGKVDVPELQALEQITRELQALPDLPEEPPLAVHKNEAHSEQDTC